MAKDKALIQKLRALYVPVVCDILDQMGYRKQFMNHEIRPLLPNYRLAGYAFTIQAQETSRFPEIPYLKQFEATDRVGEGEIIVASGCGMNTAFWGELFSTRAMLRGCAGIVVEGLVRDTHRLKEMDFPVFSKGFLPSDSFGRLEVIDYGKPIQCAGVAVNPGDLVFADYDGIVVIPHVIAEEIIAKAEEKVQTENLVRDELMAGVSVIDVYQKYGVM